MILSVIIPRHNDRVEEILESLVPLKELGGSNVEVIIVDSSDEVEVPKSSWEGAGGGDLACTVLRVQTSSRGVRLQIGIDAAVGKVLL